LASIERTKNVEIAAGKVAGDSDSRKTGRTLATQYRAIAAQVQGGQISGHEAIAATVKRSNGGVLSGSLGEAWSDVHNLLTEQFVRLVQEGAPDGEYATLLTDWATGLEAFVTDPLPLLRTANPAAPKKPIRGDDSPRR
jgi:hypothetical protein